MIPFRVTDAERAQIEAAAGRAGLTVGSYVRSRALEKPTTRAVRRAPVETAQLAQLLGILGAVAGSIQALNARQSAGDTLATADIAEALTEFRCAVAAILQALGKRPALSGRSP